MKDDSPGHESPINFNYLFSGDELIISGLELCVANQRQLMSLSLSGGYLASSVNYIRLERVDCRQV